MPLIPLALVLVSCYSSKLDNARALAIKNARFNAGRYQLSHAAYRDWAVVTSGDGTQNEDCLQGDGWAVVDLVDRDSDLVLGLECSTVSAENGCLEEHEFQTREFAREEGWCQSVERAPLYWDLATLPERSDQGAGPKPAA